MKQAPCIRGGIEARGLRQPCRSFRDSDLEPRRGGRGRAGGGARCARGHGRQDESRSQRPSPRSTSD
jgi:hypothetical protein